MSIRCSVTLEGVQSDVIVLLEVALVVGIFVWFKEDNDFA